MFAMHRRSSIDRVCKPSPCEFHRFVQRTVHTDHADDVQNHVLAGDVFRQFAGEVELIADGTFKPGSPVAMPAAISVEPTPVENAPKAP